MENFANETILRSTFVSDRYGNINKNSNQQVFLNISSEFLILIQTKAARLNVRQLLNSSLIYIWIIRYLSLPFLLFHNLAYLVLTNFSLIPNSGMYLTGDYFLSSIYRFTFLMWHFRIFKVFGF